jgi:signal transduction histidine kinase
MGAEHDGSAGPASAAAARPGWRELLDAVLTIGSDLDLPAMLQRIVASAVSLVDATYGALGVLDESGTRLVEFVTVGVSEQVRRAIGHVPEGHGILGLLIADAKPLRLADLTTHPGSYGFPPHHPRMRSFLGVPILVRDDVFGNLYLTDKSTADAFSADDEELVVGLAAAAGVAIEHARLTARVHEFAVLEDRERIARDLHDTVIQRLFATGMSLQSTVRVVATEPAAAVARIGEAVDDLDLTIKEIRSAIFGLEHGRVAADGLRGRILTSVREAVTALGFEPRVILDGPVDSGVDSGLAADVLATLREALSNVARHARATRVEVEVEVAEEVRLRVVDDGIGPPTGPTSDGRGLANMAARAEKRGGSLELRRREPRGTVLEWRVPRR